MEKLPYNKYKNHLKSILAHFGKPHQTNPEYCFAHGESVNSKSKSMILKADKFDCKSCGEHGDIYDAIGIIEGISDKGEQFKRVSQIIDGGNYMPEKKQTEFYPDSSAEKKLLEYVVSMRDTHKTELEEYFKKRKCTEDMINAFSSSVGYWPGYEKAESELGKDILRKAGVPGKNPKTKKYSWGNSGPIVKIGRGFKYFFYDEDGKSNKVGTKTCRSFPAFIKEESDSLYLTEGELSALSLLYAGFKNVSPVGGVNGITKDFAEEYFKYDNIYIVFDGDHAAKKSIYKVKEKLRAMEYPGDIFIVKLPKGKDPDDMIKENRVEEIHEAIEKSRFIQSEIKEAETTILESKTETIDISSPFYFAGYDEKSYYVVPKNQSIPIAVGRPDGSIKGLMYDLAPREFWFNKFKKVNEEGVASLDVAAAVSWFRENGQRSGLYDQNSAMGLGAHYDDDKIIFNTGDGLYLFNEKKKIDYVDYNGKKFYSRSKKRFDLSGEAWDLNERVRLYNEIKKYGLKHPADFMIIAGWLVLAPFASILERRPHLAIVGKRGTGKTTLIENIIAPALGELALNIEGTSTEAGARQFIGQDCLPTTVDEFETGTSEKKKRVSGILDLARSAYGGLAETVKGTQGQKALIFKTKIMFMFFAIKIDLLNDANKSRIPVIEMTGANNELNTNFDFTGLRRYAFENLDRIKPIIKSAREFMSSYKFDNRTLDTYSTLLGGFWFLVSDYEFLKDKNKELNDAIPKACDLIESKINTSESDEQKVLNYILQHRIRIASDVEKTIYEMIEEIYEIPEYSKILSRYGIRVDHQMKIEKELYDSLAISGTHLEIKKILEKTEYEDYRDILGRHPSILFSGELKPIRMLGKNGKSRCLVLDWGKVKESHDFYDDSVPF